MLTIVCVFLLGSSLILSKSRTALIAGIISLVVLYSDRLRGRHFTASFVLLVILGLFSVFGLLVIGAEQRLVDKAVVMVSKSGDISELTSATGRTDIWGEAVRLFLERPLFGYGLNTAPEILLEFALSPHNAMLNALLSGGIFAGVLMLIMQAQMGWSVFSSPNLVIRALCAVSIP